MQRRDFIRLSACAAAVLISNLNAAASDNSNLNVANDGLILLGGGTFMMGSPASERLRADDETRHEVVLSPFFIDPCEVRQSDFERVMGANPSRFRGADLPVENVSWYDAIEYCNRLSRERGLTPCYAREGDDVSWERGAEGYRLLTEAEWEYACRAGTSTIFSGRDQVHSDFMNFEGTYPYLCEENYVRQIDPSVKVSRNRDRTVAVSDLPPNAWGLKNMHGNVSEWVFDIYGAYDPAARENPTGARAGAYRVNRGGGYNDFGKQLRCAYRAICDPHERDQNMGFRVARNASNLNVAKAVSGAISNLKAGEGRILSHYDMSVVLPSKPRVLVAYYSYSGNTAKAAEILANLTGARLVEIRMRRPYSGNIYTVSHKDLYANARPPIEPLDISPADYDAVLLGFPTWWSTLPPPVATFAQSFDMNGKSVFVFSSNGGTRFGDSVSDLSKMLPKARVGEPFEFYYGGGWGLKSDLKEWLSRIKIPIL